MAARLIRSCKEEVILCAGAFGANDKIHSISAKHPTAEGRIRQRAVGPRVESERIRTFPLKS